MTSAPESPAQHVAAIPGVTSAVVTDGRMLVGVEPGLDATTVALRSAIVLNALGAGLTVEVIGGRRTPSPAPLPVRWAGLSMTNMARVACAAVLAGSAGLAAVSNVSGSVSAPRFQASPALRHHRAAVPPVVLGPGGAFPIAPAPAGEGTVATNVGVGATAASGAKPATGAPPEVGPNAVVLVSIRHTQPPPAPAVPAPVAPATPAPAKPAPAPTITSPVVSVTTPAPTPRPTVPVATVPQVVVAGNKPPVVAPVPPPAPPTVTPPTTSGDGSDHDGSGHGSGHGDGSDHGSTGSHGDDGSHAHAGDDGSDHRQSTPAVTTPVRARDGSASGEVVDEHARRLPSS